MSLRPRYSLLTLLLLTALVAGGVKLWYGPHHVVVMTKPQEVEEEYTYTRDLRGKRIIQGPLVRRNTDGDGNRWRIEVEYHRNGVNTQWLKQIEMQHPGMTYHYAVQFHNPFDDVEDLELLPAELHECEAAIKQEYAWLEQHGYRLMQPKPYVKPESWK